jgi:hypothetical protein
MSWFVATLKLLGVRRPKVFVETGTFRGDNALYQSHWFLRVHTIELDPTLALAAKMRFADMRNINVHEGDSGEVLSMLAEIIREPALFYLDAHWSGGATAFGPPEDSGCPVLRELQALSLRPYADVIVIDDMRLMGTVEWSGQDGTDWPRTQFDFRHVTPEAITRAYARPHLAYETTDYDRLVLVPEVAQESGKVLADDRYN